MKILLNKYRGKNSTNVNNKIPVSFSNKKRLLPLENIDEIVDEYERYLIEKKKSNIYRLSFNITPICSNVLFNNISEVIYKEGSDKCIVFGKNGVSGATDIIPTNIANYCDYKNIKFTGLTRHEMIKDTAFSHKDIGGVVYHCGYDIFNNHTLRKKEFNVINKLKNSKNDTNGIYFNTILAFKRDYSGEIVKEKGKMLTGENTTFDKHLYQVDNILSFEESINENLVEKNGWVGFINPSTLPIKNYGDISINKCMNNNKSCEMIDMYPDRSLYSFIPKVNKYRGNRLEKNWDYCLTYPYENYYNEIVEYNNGVVKVNGLKCVIVDDIEKLDYSENNNITLKTYIKNNISRGNLVSFILIGKQNKNDCVKQIYNRQTVASLGLNNKEKEYYFTVNGNELLEELNKFDEPLNVEIRVRRINEGGACEYYFRKFKRIPNFRNSNINVNEIIEKNTIDEYSNIDFNSTINNMGFSRTIYSDRNAQLLFNDNINLSGLRDNLGREISEIYLTIIKNNSGNKEWYDDKNFTSSAITFSRCFSQITSGIDILDPEIKDYNIHTIHNVNEDLVNVTFDDGTDNGVYRRLFVTNGSPKIYRKPKTLENDITVCGCEDKNGCFLGDIVEFNKHSLIENTLEKVYHRFNTRQREIVDKEYQNMTYDDIISDDYELGGANFSATTLDYYNKYFFLNIDAEGYYYQPHYKIPLKEYNKTIRQGSHTLVEVSENSEINKISDNIYSAVLKKNYYLENSENVILYHKITNKKINGTIIDIEGVYKNKVKIKVILGENESLFDYYIFKYNVEKTNTAYELDDGTGRYLWKNFKEDHEYDIDSDISKYSFTNNAHYINQNIVFYLHRQDPDGRYNIGNSSANILSLNNLGIEGDINDYSGIETMSKELEEGTIC